MTSLAGQTYSFLVTIAAGGALGLLFDVYRVLRSIFRPRQIAAAVADLLFWLIVTPAVFALLLASNWGELRLYVAVGLGLGLVLYYLTFSATVIWCLAGLAKQIGFITGRLIYGLVHIVLLPLSFFPSRRHHRGARPQKLWSPAGLAARPRGFSPRTPMAWRRPSWLRFFQRTS